MRTHAARVRRAHWWRLGGPRHPALFRRHNGWTWVHYIALDHPASKGLLR